MQRKQFITAAFSALPMLSIPRNLTGTEPSKPFIIRKGESRNGKKLMYKGVHPNDVLISKKDTNGALSVFSFTGYAKVGPSTHLHYNQDELFHIVEGNYRFVVGEEKFEAAAGDTVFLPRNIAHCWLQLTDKGTMLYAVQPAGSLEEFFEEMDGLTKAPTEEESKARHERHGMKLIGPGLKP